LRFLAAAAIALRTAKGLDTPKRVSFFPVLKYSNLDQMRWDDAPSGVKSISGGEISNFLGVRFPLDLLVGFLWLNLSMIHRKK